MPATYRKRAVLLISITLLVVGGIVKWRGDALNWAGDDSSRVFASAAMLRIGLVLGALWLAWDSLKRPARWLPAGAAMMGVVGLIVIAMQPKLAIVAIPALGVLISLAAVVRSLRGRG